MEIIAKRIVNYLDGEQKFWDDLDRMRMMLGIQIVLHNIIMIGTILLVAQILDIVLEATVLLMAYGALKMSAGGIHFKKSSYCLMCTGMFVGAGVFISKHLNMELFKVIVIYLICFIVLTIIAPQGTENNPISEKNYDKLKIRTIFLVLIYLIITIVMEASTGRIPYLLFVAVVFETLSLFPLYIIKSRRI